MHTLSATQASRGFAALLDMVARGETVVITRDGVPVARIEPETDASGARALALFAKPAPDSQFADDLDWSYRTSRELPARWDGEQT